jgi:hypothetical protein
MNTTRRRQEFQFWTIKDRPDLDYVPAKSRNPRKIELFSGKPPGSVIAIQQSAGIEALSRTYTYLDSDVYGLDDLRAVSDVVAIASLGTAHHTFGEPEAENLNYRRIKLAKVLDPKTGERLTARKLVSSIQTRLATAAELAMDIEDRVLERKDTSKRNDQLGRMLATVGFEAAALHDGIYNQYGNLAEVQQASWLSARAASLRALALSDTIGVRPTIAQLTDEQSPLRRYMNDNPWFIPAPSYGVVEDQTRMAMKRAYERDEARRTLF